MFPLTDQHIDRALERLGMPDVASATIRQIVALASVLEQDAGEKFIRLELGNPGIPAESFGIEAQCDALRGGCPRMYPDVSGLPALKQAGSRFLKSFLGVDIAPGGIIPTVGSMQASFTLQILLRQRLEQEKDTILFINPGFPAQRHQAKVLGIRQESFDIYDYRGAALADKLEEVLSSGRITAMIYSNPNNPAWINLTEEELGIIGRAATAHDVIVIEDLAYLGMDFRVDFSRPCRPPYIPTVARYTRNCILLVSASKIFSYAGERIALVCMTEEVFSRKYDYLAKFYDMPAFGDAYVFGVLYTASSGTSHSAQYAMAAMLEAACRGELNFVAHTREYARRASLAKQAFLDCGFRQVYERDGNRPVSDGFFFTMGYGDLTGDKLQEELLKYGISTISLTSTGSDQQGIRGTVSMLTEDSMVDTLRHRLALFQKDH